MFTGIIESIGKVKSIVPKGEDIHIDISFNEHKLKVKIKHGDSYDFTERD